jgi:hypothetical protein
MLLKNRHPSSALERLGKRLFAWQQRREGGR